MSIFTYPQLLGESNNLEFESEFLLLDPYFPTSPVLESPISGFVPESPHFESHETKSPDSQSPSPSLVPSFSSVLPSTPMKNKGSEPTLTY